MALMGMYDRVDESVVMAVPEPQFTDTWHPVSHAKVITTLSEAVKETGMEIVSRDYSLNKTGTRMFGYWKLSEKYNGCSWAMGFRQAIDKTMCLALAGGNHVTVCDNMSLSGDYIEFRKHTVGLNEETLRELAKRAIANLVEKLKEFAEWHRKLKQDYLSQDRFKVLLYDLMSAGAFAPSKFKNFHRAYEAEVIDLEKKQAHGETVYAMHGAATRLMRDESLFRVGERNKALYRTINRFAI